MEGKAKELTIGNYPDTSISKAREIAAVQRVAIKQGFDVATQNGTPKNSNVQMQLKRRLGQ
jgi:hypothetical protein